MTITNMIVNAAIRFVAKVEMTLDCLAVKSWVLMTRSPLGTFHSPCGRKGDNEMPSDQAYLR